MFVRGVRSDSPVTPLSGVPNTNLDRYNKKTEKFVSRRKFGESGAAEKDLDVADRHKSYDHAHDFDGNRRSVSDRLLTKREQKEIKKQKRKGRVGYERFDKICKK